MAGLEDLLFLGAFGAAAYGAYQKLAPKTQTQAVKSGGQVIKRTYKQPSGSSNGYTVSLDNTPIAIGDVRGEIRPYTIDDSAVWDRFSENDFNYDPTPLRITARIEEQQAVLTTPSNSAELSASDAFKLVQAGKYHTDVKNRRISTFYYWKDVMVSSTISDGNRKRIPLAHYQNASVLADILDNVAVEYGGKIPINSWLRIQSTGSFHTDGRAADFGASYSVCKKGGKLFTAARKVSGLKGIGYPTSPSHNSLHVDIGSSGGRKQGYHLIFIDNGFDGGGYESLKVL
jgi:hypothetical protein